MRRFTELFTALDEAKGTRAKHDALVSYFRSAPPADAAWAVAILTGERIRRPVKGPEFHALAAEAAGLPAWLIDECRAVVGDGAEAIARLLPDAMTALDLPLATLVEEHSIALAAMDERQRGASIRATWAQLDYDGRFVWHKIMFGGLRVGVAKRSVVRALAEVADVDPALMTHRMSGPWTTTADRFERLLGGEREADAAFRPYPFFLAHPVEDAGGVDELGPADAWQAEWKYDGVRAQLIARDGATVVWSRGEESMNGAFPELLELARRLPAGTVLDGEVVAWEDDSPLGFNALQTRLGRKDVGPVLFHDVPVVFMAFDLLEFGGDDVRAQPIDDRRAALESLFDALGDVPNAALAPLVPFDTWTDLAKERDTAHERGVEGLMLKRRSAPYGVGRPRGDWWKWKVDPHTVDVVLVAAERGSGRRAGLYTAFSFAAWRDDALVTVTRAYSGLTDEEFREVNKFIRTHTVSRHGPVRVVEPLLVFEIGFQGVQVSTRHKAGLALRFPRMLRWRRDLDPVDADTIASLEARVR